METIKAHPFELAGMGTGPFRFVGAVSMPSASLAEHNPSGYSAALAAMPRDLENGCGNCRHCGRGIMLICIVTNSEGKRYGVGCDCVLKTDEPALCDKAKVAQARHNRNVRRLAADVKRAAALKAWQTAICNDRGETNLERLARESREAAERQAAAAARAVSRFAFLIPTLEGEVGAFCVSLLGQIRAGIEPRGRALEILGEIYARRKGGRMGSAAYDKAFAEFETLTAQPQP